jgi:hypothetical protein
MSFSNSTIKKIVDSTESFFEGTIFKLDVDYESVQKGYPWHSIFFTPEAAVAALKERSVVTSIGLSFVPKLAKIVAEDTYNEVALEYPYHCKLDKGANRKINRICQELRGKVGNTRRMPNHEKEMAEINEAKTGELDETLIILDFYVGDHENGPLYYEIKAPKPNIDQTEATKIKMLQYLSVSEDNQAFYALHYNPYVTREKYNWSPPKGLMDFEKEVLLGEEMWNYLGDDNTYDELYELLIEISEQKWEEFEEREESD